MPTKIGIINKGFAKVGQAPITNLTDGSDRSNLADLIYEDTLEEVLSETAWNFATKRFSFASASVTIPFTDDGLTYAYTYPSDCLVVWKLSSDESIWRIEIIDGIKYILSDASVLKTWYTFKNTNPSQYSSLFADALSAKLAAEFSYSVDQSEVQYDSRLRKYREQYLAKAISRNAQEGTTIQPKQDHFLLAKFGQRPSYTKAGIRYYG